MKVPHIFKIGGQGLKPEVNIDEVQRPWEQGASLYAGTSSHERFDSEQTRTFAILEPQ